MKFRTMMRHVREGVKNIARNRWMTFASIISVMVTLLILGIFLLMALNVNYIAENIESDVEIRAFVEQGMENTDLENVETLLQGHSKVDSVAYIPKEVAIETFVDNIGEEARHFEGLMEEEENPLPDTYVIQTYEPQDTAVVAEDVEQLDEIYQVNYGGETTETLFSVTNSIRNIGVVFVVGLAFTAMLLIANTIKTTINARRTEIEIMKLVGASNAFVRWPFFIEGLLLGTIGALIPATLLVLGYDQLLNVYYDSMQIPFLQLLPLYPVAFQIALVLIVIGALIGVWGSLLSVRRFLRV